MKFKNTLIAVSDMEASKRFYREVLGLRVTADFGANVTLTGGVCLQTLSSWQGFIDSAKVTLGGNDAELYFEEEHFDAFVSRIEKLPDIRLVHGVKEHTWGQRALRFYDPDMHIIEVGEPLTCVCRRFMEAGMDASQVAQRMDIPEAMVRRLIKQLS